LNIPEAVKIDNNMAVVFKHYFEFNGAKFNAVYETDDGTLMFFDTEAYFIDGEKIPVKDIRKCVS